MERPMRLGWSAVVAAVLYAATLSVTYGRILARLAVAWASDDNYSHGFLILPIAAYLVWRRRMRLLQADVRPSVLGLVIVIGSVGLLLAGSLGAELFLTRVSLIGVLAGSILFVLGWNHLRILAFPLAFLMLMVPLPAIIFNQIAFPLQLLASRLGTAVLLALDVPALREGNLITLANTKLEVAEACSGIRSLISLLTLGIIYAYFKDSRAWVRVIVALLTIPVAILTNGLRVAGTGILAHYYGPETADGFFHAFSGWLVFIAAFMLLFIALRCIQMLAPPVHAPVPAAA